MQSVRVIMFDACCAVSCCQFASCESICCQAQEPSPAFICLQICRFADASVGMPNGGAASEDGGGPVGLLQHLPFKKEILLVICIAATGLLVMLCCCAYLCSSRNSEGTVIMSSVDHMIARQKSKALSRADDSTYSLDPLRRSGKYLLGGKDSLGASKWGELPEIAENEALAGDAPGQIRATGTIPQRPQVRVQQRIHVHTTQGR